jgi:hypothetical protein
LTGTGVNETVGSALRRRYASRTGVAEWRRSQELNETLAARRRAVDEARSTVEEL